MPLSSRFGVCLVYLLLILPEQGCPQCYRPMGRSPGPVIPPCCMKASKARVREPIVSCFEQRETTFPHCRIRAFIFSTENITHQCVDPAARWLRRTFKVLEKSQICCSHL